MRHPGRALLLLLVAGLLALLALAWQERAIGRATACPAPTVRVGAGACVLP